MRQLPGNRRLSVSSYGTYLECPQSYQFSYVEKIPRAEKEVPVHWRFGSVIHYGLEHAYVAFRDAQLTGSLLQVRERALEAIHEAWEKFEMPATGGELERALGMTHDTLARLTEHHENILGIEELILGETELGTPFVGYADLIRRDGDVLEVRDYKVRAKVSTPEDLLREVQGPAYVHFVRRKHPWAKHLRFSHLYPNHGPRYVHVDVSPEAMATTVERLDAVADAIIADTAMAPRPGEHCGYCTYRDRCPAWSDKKEDADLKRQMNF